MSEDSPGGGKLRPYISRNSSADTHNVNWDGQPQSDPGDELQGGGKPRPYISGNLSTNMRNVGVGVALARTILTHLGDELPLAVEIIDQQVFTQVVLISVKGATVVNRRELIHKGYHPTIILQHKGINGNPLASTSLHL